MEFELNVSDELAKKIEQSAAFLGITPEEWIIREAEKATQTSHMVKAEELFDERASAYEALAESEKTSPYI